MTLFIRWGKQLNSILLEHKTNTVEEFHEVYGIIVSQSNASFYYFFVLMILEEKLLFYLSGYTFQYK